MGGNDCPSCRGELVDDTTNNKWIITLVTPDAVASGLDPDEFAIDVTMSGGSHQQGLSSNSGSSSGGETTYQWTITRPGTPISGVITMDHGSLGPLQKALSIS
ncbi:hypothetical protein [Paraliomyxa miuraensis]|uniref:hypothetical protein n=1 Tax=Paraliomyxa miuraensis TaxID=376150 RepID=UPI002256D709|nr:hypothetical protein [Paraliomyxa miuraensis]MCX4240588.1 hypothetical protein [Paraliomyxa miuraensis]